MQTLERASKDTEEWVVVTAHALKGFPTKSGLNFDLESATDKFADALNHISSAMSKHGISFHPKEFAYMDKKRLPACSSASKDFQKLVPTVKQHFKLSKNSTSTISREGRLSQLRAIAKESSFSPQQSTTSSLTPPTAAGSAAGSENIAVKPGAGRGQPGSSLFIQRPGNRVPMRKPSTGSKPSFLRAGNASRPNPVSTQPRASIQSILSGGANAQTSAEDSSTPKGFIKPSKIQMIDINESAAIQENIDKANAEVQAQNELKKQQAKQAAEDKKRVAEERKLEMQREREEKKERRKQEAEERKRKKEQERQEAAMQAAVAKEEAKLAAQEAEGDSPPKAKRVRRSSDAYGGDTTQERRRSDAGSPSYESMPSSVHPPIPSMHTMQPILPPSQPPIMPLPSPSSTHQTQHHTFYYSPPGPHSTQLPAPEHMLQNAQPNLPPLYGYSQPPMSFTDSNNEQYHQTYQQNRHYHESDPRAHEYYRNQRRSS
ncbi:hypothetical protein VKS41_005533 [Umbelopsis sp. WA50703]